MNLFSRLKTKVWTEQWNIGVSQVSADGMFQQGLEGKKVQWLFAEKKNGFFADPFFAERDGKLFVFFEEFDNQTQKGIIAYSVLQNVGGKLIASGPKTALSKPFHLSYPFLFAKDGELLMIPETADANEVAIYKPAHFPDVWVKAKTIVPNFPGVDPSIVFWKGKYWLFCTHGKNGDSSELHVFFADELFGPWHSHKKNPVKIDLASARPAGAFFEKDGELFRPAQNCSRTYGGSLVLNKIAKLDEEDFLEETAGEVNPDFSSLYDKGIHTVNQAGQWAVFDGKRFSGVKKYLSSQVESLKKRVGEK